MTNFKIEFKWALVFSFFSLVWIYLEKGFGWHHEGIAYHQIFTELLIIPFLYIVLLIFEIKQKRLRYYKGKMTWDQGFLSGSITAAIITVLNPIVQYFFVDVISPKYFHYAIERAISNGSMNASGASDIFNLKATIIDGVVFNLAMGIVTAAIIAYFMKTETRNNLNS